MTIAFWCVFAGGLLPILVVFVAKQDPRLDVANPRDVHLHQTGVRKRAYGAHLNGLEAFPFFATAVVMASIRAAPAPWIDGLALAWLVTRLAYTGVYLADLYRIRPGLWALSVLLSVAIFLVAGFAGGVQP